MKLTSVALFYSAIITSASLSLGGAYWQAAPAQDSLALSKNPDADTKPFAAPSGHSRCT
jgi:hypothetical protein